MTEGWQTKRLEQVIEKSGTVDPRKEPDEFFHYVDVSSVSNKTFRIEETSEILGKDAPSRARRLIRSGDVLFATIRPTLRRIAVVPPELDQQVCSTGYFVFRTKPELDNRFLYYFLFTDRFMDAMESLQSGASYPAVNDTQVKKQEISYPPLEEQKRIVAILDEAFEGIEKAQANAEKNLANARELFESYQNFIFEAESETWTTEQLGSCFRLRSGDGLTSKAMVPGNFSVFGGNGIAGTHNEHNLSGDNVVIGRVGALCGNARHITEDIWLTDNAFKVVDKQYGFDNAFLTYLLNYKNLRSLARQSAQPVISNSSLKALELKFPNSTEEQRIIAGKLDLISNEVDRLIDNYKRKLQNLTDLKQSLLQKAFSGELTSSNVVAFTRPVSQQQDVATTAPEFAAKVLAYAHNWHASQQRDRTFGRVKTQKILHMAESVAGVDMGRQPIKDAAGPNDFQHMLRAEDWAKNNLFFEFTPRLTGNGYDFKKLGDYNKLIGGALEAVKPYKDKLEKILALMMPMNTREAEVLATVHAAWNNLLLDNAEITDDAIIHEARENWTESKRSIPENEFQKAITTIRTNGIVPDGTAKRVTGQENLF